MAQFSTDLIYPTLLASPSATPSVTTTSTAQAKYQSTPQPLLQPPPIALKRPAVAFCDALRSLAAGPSSMPKDIQLVANNRLIIASPPMRRRVGFPHLMQRQTVSAELGEVQLSPDVSIFFISRGMDAYYLSTGSILNNVTPSNPQSTKLAV